MATPAVPFAASLLPDAIAHRDGDRVHGLRDHLLGTAARAAGSCAAASLPWADYAAMTAALHDLGKYGLPFRRRIASDGDHTERDDRVDHSTAGAVHAARRHGIAGLAGAYIIAGHHAGLPDCTAGDGHYGCLKARLGREDLLATAMEGQPDEAIFGIGNVGVKKGWLKHDPALWIRMLASVVFDADFRDTEAFFDPTRTASRAAELPSLIAMADVLARHMDGLATRAGADNPVNIVRRRVLAHCREAASGPRRRVLRLTAGTGSGKTLAALSFALEHARVHRLDEDAPRRVIVAVPFTSIIEQTADVFRRIFQELGPHAVLEHHSALAVHDGDDRAWARLASETWDAPLIVTTTVQLLESLFSNRPSRLRRIHNIAGSIIVIDEVQALPVGLLRPILSVLRTLTVQYGCTVLLTTATQPAIETVLPGLEAAEIQPDTAATHQALRRVRVRLPASLTDTVSWDAVATAMASSAARSVLTIVNTRREAVDLARLLTAGTFHLSTWMCGAHRSDALDRIRALAAQVRRDPHAPPVRVVSTSLIEAGVDLDMDEVMRAIAPYPSLAQAAGRANREGELPDLGTLVVFVPEQRRHDDAREQEIRLTWGVLMRHRDDPLSPQACRDYYVGWFQRMIGDDPARSAFVDTHGIMDLLRMEVPPEDARRKGLVFQFRTAAERFRMIDGDQVPVLVPYGAAGAALVAEARRVGDRIDRGFLRRSQRFVVSVRQGDLVRLVDAGHVEPLPSGVSVLVDGRYDGAITGTGLGSLLA